MTTAFQSNAFQNSGFQVDPVTGAIYAVDQNDTCNMVGTVTGGGEVTVDTHDGFTKDEIKRIKKLQKKLAQAEADRIQARLDKRLARKQAIRDLVDPTQVKETKVESVSEVKIDKPSIDLKKLNATIINLERQKQQLLRTVELRNQVARAQALLAIHEAQLAAERDDEEALLLLIQTHTQSIKRLMTTYTQVGMGQDLGFLNTVGIQLSQLTKQSLISVNLQHHKHGVVSH